MNKHPRRRGGMLLLALAAPAALIFAGEINLLSVYGQAVRAARQETDFPAFQTALAVMLIPGAFLAAVPERIRRRKEPRLRSTWQGCLGCLIGGMTLMLAAGLAHGGDGLHVTGLLQGSVSAYAFAAAALLAGLIAARLHERRNA